MNITNLRRIANGGSLIAKFDLVGKYLTIRGMGIFRKADGSTWISEPASKIDKRDGTTDWWKHVQITDDDLREHIATQAKQALAELDPTAGEDNPF